MAMVEISSSSIVIRTLEILIILTKEAQDREVQVKGSQTIVGTLYKGVPCKFGKKCKFIERCRYCDSPAHGIHVCPKLESKKNEGGNIGNSDSSSQAK